MYEKGGRLQKNKHQTFFTFWIKISIFVRYFGIISVKQYLDPVYQKLIWFQHGSENIKGQRCVLSSVGFVDVTFMGRHQQLRGHMHSIGLGHIDCNPGLGIEDYEVMVN